jgi:DNA-binding response OmpR family regulator
MARILVVDDDHDIRTFVRLNLEGAGHVVAEAGDGVTALEAFERQAPGVVITDIHMPEKDGLGLLRELRKRHHQAKIIAMSGGSSLCKTDFLDAAMSLGASAILYKPFTIQQLVRSIAAVLGSVSLSESGKF